MFLYRFGRADQMIDHNFSDDVAICLAWNKKQAMKKLSTMYSCIEPKEVYRVRWKYIIRGVVLTDY